MKMFDRDNIDFKTVRERKNKVKIQSSDTVETLISNAELNASSSLKEKIEELAGKIIYAKKQNGKIITAFGAHTIKNKLSPVLKELIQNKWVDHLATNGAGIIHDWELSYLGETSEDVRENVKTGSFGIWEETGFYINLAIVVGAWEGLGYGESVGKMINDEEINIPDQTDIIQLINSRTLSPSKCAAGWDLIDKIDRFSLKNGKMKINHPFRNSSIQAAAFKNSVPFTGHPMIGHDIIYTHPMNCGAAIGRCAERDFLGFAESINNLENGIYISLGSAVMSPMIFEKSISMSRNIAIQENRSITDFSIYVADIAESSWDWNSDAEPDQNDPAYYLRYCKTFSRMGGKMQYITADNRFFLPLLNKYLKENV